ncbi:MAG: amidohydrolase family protein [Proteobacteria bacterium]|nr:amidohydrolase family protein [Pseudomonadota bacterium]
MSSFLNRTAPALIAVMGLLGAASAPAADKADLVVRNARIYTVDAQRTTAEALAVRDGRLVYVGTSAGVAPWIGLETRVLDLHGRLVLPGLIDAHIHPLDIADLDLCDLDDRPVSLAELSRFVAACVDRYQTPPGGLLRVYQWNYTNGNQPDPKHATLRAALDAASTTRRIEVLGEDGHHGAYNSLALASARNSSGAVVGLSKSTLAGDFAALRPFVGVDDHGEPNGAVNEDARGTINLQGLMYLALDEVVKVPERISARLAASGITGILDAYAPPAGQVVYDKLLASHKLTARVELAQFYNPSATRKPDGTVDYDAILTQANLIRAKYATSELIRADVVKIFADGGIEGDPLAVPPQLPNGASLRPWLQPRFGLDGHGKLEVKGYVDTGSPLCRTVQQHPGEYATAEQVGAFMRANGYHPAQCTISDGNLQHDRAIIMEYARRMHLAGYSLHIHIIGNRAARTAIDAIEAARAADGVSTTRDALAHLQLVDPSDVARIGRDHLYAVFTYAWASFDPDYDLSVVPWVQEVHGNGYQALHVPGSYYASNVYPARSIREAGGILAAGSDAPVDTRDPRPFINMEVAVLRHLPGQQPLNAAQGITLPQVIEAYTINGARMLNVDKDAGSLEVGKSADFIVVDRDILKLADTGHTEDVAKTHVLGTWFQGRQIYRDGL